MARRVRPLYLACSLLMPGLCAAGEEKAAFRGLRFDVELAKQIPECPKSGTFYAYKIPGSCWQQSDECLEAPAAPAGCGQPQMVRLLDEQNSIFDASAEVATDSEVFVDVDAAGKLRRLDFYVPGERVERVEAHFRAQYGAPASSKTEPWNSRKGVAGTMRRDVWDWRGLRIQLEAPSERGEQGKVEVSVVAGGAT